VLFGGVAADGVVVQNDNEITCKAPPNASGPCDVTVVKQAGTAVATNAFMYYAPPTLTSVDPNSGTRDGGQTVTLVGSGFTNGDPGKPIVSFGSTPSAFVTVIDDNTLEALTPESFVEKAVDVSVENNYGKATLPVSFVYTGPIPTVSEVIPSFGSMAGGDLVTVKGEYFTTAGGQITVTFGTAPAVGVTRIDDQTLTCITPISATPSLVPVSVGNANGTSTTPDLFQYIPPPSITNITPTTGPENTALPFTITGTGFQDYNAGTPVIKIGGLDVTDIVVVDDTQITCSTPLLAEGTYDLNFENNRGDVMVGSAFTFEWVPQWISTYGTNLGLSDDSNGTCNLGFSFPFFGNNYTTVYACSNGAVTMGSAGSTSLYSGQFSGLPQISICAYDLNPGNGGGVYFNPYSSAMGVITYAGVPWYSNGGSITAQLLLRASGKFAILFQTVTWYNPMVVGLSPGSSYSNSISVDWSTSPDIGTNVQASETFSGSSDLIGYATVFTPDGSGGYTTERIALP